MKKEEEKKLRPFKILDWTATMTGVLEFRYLEPLIWSFGYRNLEVEVKQELEESNWGWMMGKFRVLKRVRGWGKMGITP